MALDLTEVGFANEAFYLVFEAKDYAAMAHLWSAAEGSLCLHPGWPVLRGRDAILASWRKILANPEQGQVSFYGAQVSAVDAGVVMVSCYEQAAGSVMVATNLFREEDGQPRLFSHQAGFCGHPPAQT